MVWPEYDPRTVGIGGVPIQSESVLLWEAVSLAKRKGDVGGV